MMTVSRIFSVAIDGPAGAGKSTVAQAVARELGAVHLDTGAMYRTVGLYMSRSGITGTAQIASSAGLPDVRILFDGEDQHMLLGDEDVTDLIHTPEASMMASKVSTVPEVRERMVDLQRRFAEGHSVVMDGRDIGTYVLPDATVKIYLTASCEVRAQRRYDQLKDTGTDVSYEQVLSEIVQRDYIDANREASPMRQAEDALCVDTSEMTPDQVIAKIVAIVKDAVKAEA